jgi:hypothetical protein
MNNLKKIDLLEENIKNIKNPLLTLYIIFNSDIIDENKTIFLKLFIKYHIDLMLTYNFYLFQELLINNPITFNLIIDIYIIIIKQFNILTHLHKFKKIFPNRFFWLKNINEQITHLNMLLNKFMSLFDGSKGLLFFHHKLKGLDKTIEVNTSGYSYHVEAMIDRLRETYLLFKYSFFLENNILLLSTHDFLNLKFENMIKYTEYIFNKIHSILSQYILFFKLYEINRHQLINLISINNIEINIDDVSSDIESDDLLFILK